MINIPMKVTESYNRNNISSISQANIRQALSAFDNFPGYSGV